jgi:teichoic acid transport system permease protein
MGVALISARLTVHFRDMTQIIPLITRIMFYSSGIFYSLDQVLADKPDWLLTLAQLNPVHDFITLVRSAMLTGYGATTLEWTVAIGSGVVTLLVGVIYFWRAEERYGRD